jgi:YjjG family noncanonical pyrimidine nucleotidase
MAKYKCIFFDLDHTLWDYETNSMQTLHELFLQYKLESKGIREFDEFFQTFRSVNLSLWDLYDTGKITSDVIRKDRFRQILNAFDAYDEDLSDNLSTDYLNLCPSKCNVMPGALETLQYLSNQYRLTVVTNGFDEIQHIKLASGGMDQYFDHVITSQKAGHRKPSREIFDYALKLNGASHYEAIMIGDNLITDIAGAKNASIDAVLFNPLRIVHDTEVHHEISDLQELRQIL